MSSSRSLIMIKDKFDGYSGRFNRHQLTQVAYHTKELRRIADQPYSAASFVSEVYHGFWLRCHELLNYWTLQQENRRALKWLENHDPKPDPEFWAEFDSTLHDDPVTFRDDMKSDR